MLVDKLCFNPPELVFYKGDKKIAENKFCLVVRLTMFCQIYKLARGEIKHGKDRVGGVGALLMYFLYIYEMAQCNLVK